MPRGKLKHGAARWGVKPPKEYTAWCNMRQRCGNPNRPDYQYYGGRGIKVCPWWMEFANFLADMGRCPPNHSLDRVNVNGNYEPTNCRWATPSQQHKNIRPDTVCRRKGHQLTPENTYVHPKSGKRLCRTCHKERDLKFKALHRNDPCPVTMAIAS